MSTFILRTPHVVLVTIAIVIGIRAESLFAVEASSTPTSDLTKESSSATPSQHSPTIKSPPAHNPRVLFITTKDCPRCDQELARLRRPGGDFDKMRARGWRIGEGAENHLQIVDRDAISDLVQQIKVREYPTVACIENGAIVRSFQSGCTTPLDLWTFGFLANGIDQRPPAAVLESARVESTGSYHLRGNHWSVDGDWNPARETIVAHLRGPEHGSQLLVSWKIESWSYEELRSLHDDLHERYGGGISSRASSSSRDSFRMSKSQKLGH